ncbi:hypothetical protein [Streptomyces sp. NPDC007205]|uniref:hypothetical protein n=1 Tax=Streptomyces sp. NPDC007205 TaxID=3154316 RepID=UPI0033D8253F
MSKGIPSAMAAALAIAGGLQIANATTSSAMPKPIGGKTTAKKSDGRIYYDLADLNPHTQEIFRTAIKIWNDKLVGNGHKFLGVWSDLTPTEKVKLGGRAQIRGAYHDWTRGYVRGGTLGMAGPDRYLLELDTASFDDQAIKKFWDGHFGPRRGYPMTRGLNGDGSPGWHAVRNFEEWREDVWKGNLNTILHEMGHTLGLHHPQRPVRPGEVMRTGDRKFPQVDVGGANWPDSLEPSPGEVNFVKNLYRSEIRKVNEQGNRQPAGNGRRPNDPHLPRPTSDWKQGWDPAAQSWVPYADWNAKYGAKPYLSADGRYVHDSKAGWVSETWKKNSAPVAEQQSLKDAEPKAGDADRKATEDAARKAKEDEAKKRQEKADRQRAEEQERQRQDEQRREDTRRREEER